MSQKGFRKLTIEELKNVNAGETTDYEGCSGNRCCITVHYSEDSRIQVCGSIAWYFETQM